MAERERNLAPPRNGVFMPRAQVMSSDDVYRAITRIAHEIIERNHGIDHIVIIGLQTGGAPLANALAERLDEIEGSNLYVGLLDVAYFRDDITLSPVLPEASTNINLDLTGMDVILVDDVLFTGRTIRAALNALSEYGRPKSVQLAVMVDRGHRELPIRPDYVGKNLPTRRDEQVNVDIHGGVILGDVVPR